MAITKSTPAPLTGGTLWCVTIALSLATFYANVGFHYF